MVRKARTGFKVLGAGTIATLITLRLFPPTQLSINHVHHILIYVFQPFPQQQCHHHYLSVPNSLYSPLYTTSGYYFPLLLPLHLFHLSQNHPVSHPVLQTHICSPILHNPPYSLQLFIYYSIFTSLSSSSFNILRPNNTFFTSLLSSSFSTLIHQLWIVVPHNSFSSPSGNVRYNLQQTYKNLYHPTSTIITLTFSLRTPSGPGAFPCLNIFTIPTTLLPHRYQRFLHLVTLLPLLPSPLQVYSSLTPPNVVQVLIESPQVLLPFLHYSSSFFQYSVSSVFPSILLANWALSYIIVVQCTWKVINHFVNISLL